MDSDISSIFEQPSHPIRPPMDPRLDPGPGPGEESEEEVPMPPPPVYYQQPMTMTMPPARVTSIPPWDPFASIGTTAWFVMAVAFILGFVIGKLR